MSDSEFHKARTALIEYLKHKVDDADWHGVSDAANDLRVLEAKHQLAASSSGPSPSP